MAVPASPDIGSFNWRLGGPQGSGIDRMSVLFARALAAHGLQVYCRREYHSNIMGRHSYIDVALAGTPRHSHADSPDMLVCFEAETLCRHGLALRLGGVLIHSADDADVALDSLRFLDPRVREDLAHELAARDLPVTTTGVLELARSRQVQVLAVPFRKRLAELAAQLALSTRQVAPAINTLAVGLSAALLDLPMARLTEAVAQVFAGREEVIRMNQLAVQTAYGHTAGAEDWPHPQLPACEGHTAETLLLNGTQSIALGKLVAGMGFQSYYPISPASDESVWLEAHCQVSTREGEAVGPVIFQVEDELAAISMAAGAALTGARSATATSGPGLSLMTEGLGWTGMNEVPLVITHYQRGGPSTGMPTRTDQGDLQFVLHGGHGEFPRLVLASGDVESCFYDAMQAFDYADQYQVPVIHVLDKALASTLQTVPAFEQQGLHIARGETGALPTGRDEEQSFARFAVTESGISPRACLGEPGGQHWLTGVEHTDRGEVTEDPVWRERMMEKRARKLVTAAAAIPRKEKLRVFGDPDAPCTVLTWGSTIGAVRDALERLAGEGHALRAIQLRLLWPFPDRELAQLLETAAPLVVVEADYSGQFEQLLRSQLGRGADHLVVKYNGRPFSGEALCPHLRQISKGRAESRIVVRNARE